MAQGLHGIEPRGAPGRQQARGECHGHQQDDHAFFKTAAIAQGANLVRRELGLPETRVPAADARLQTDIVPKAAR